MCMNCAAQPCLQGYLMEVKLTHGCFHSHAHGPMHLLHGANCAASLWSHIMYWAVLAFPNLWVELHLVKSSVNFYCEAILQWLLSLQAILARLHGLMHALLAFMGPWFNHWAVLWSVNPHTCSSFHTDASLCRLFCSHTGPLGCSKLAPIYLGLGHNWSSHFWPSNDSPKKRTVAQTRRFPSTWLHLPP